MNEIRKVELFNVDLKHNGDNDMTLMQRDLENQEIGMKKGEKAGESKLGKLIAELLALGRTDDAQKAATDEAARNIFYKEFHIM